MLFRIDPTPYEIEVRSIEAQIVSDQARTRADRAKVSEADARLANAVAGGKQVNERLNAATGQVTSLEASLELARKRLSQNRELAAAGAGSKFDLEQSETKVNELNAQLATARANQQAVRDELAGQVGGDLASVAAAKAQVATAQAQLGASEAQLEATRARLDNARWELQQTVTRAPADGLAVNVQLRQGAFVTGMPLNEVMTFVEYRVPDLRPLRPERAASGRTGQRSRDRARDTPGPHHQGPRGLHPVGAGAGPARCVGKPAAHDDPNAAGAVPRQAGHRRQGQGPVPGVGRARPRGDLHEAVHAHSPGAQGHYPGGGLYRLPGSEAALMDAMTTRLPRSACKRWQSAGLLATGAALLGMVAGCAVKAPPAAIDIQKEALPNVTPPPQWAAAATTGAAIDGWVATFQDAQLTVLVADALAHNADLRVGASRVEQARLHAKLAGAQLGPSVDLLARGGGKMSGDESGLQGGVLTATWELDLWARVRAGRAAAAASAAGAQADYEYARQSIAALVVKSWFLLTEAGLQLQAARETVRASDELIRLADTRFKVGAGDEQDLATARSNAGTYRDVQRQLEQAREQAIQSLEMLLGRYPAAALTEATSLPTPPLDVPAGLPSELLERRPDVVAAERRVAAAFHRIQEAKAARLPRITLTGGVSSITSELFVMKERDNPIWSAGANLLAPLYKGGALKTQVESVPRSNGRRLPIHGGGRAGVRRGRKRLVGRARRARSRTDPHGDPRRQPALARSGADQLQGRQHRLAHGRTASAGTVGHSLGATCESEHETGVGRASRSPDPCG